MGPRIGTDRRRGLAAVLAVLLLAGLSPVSAFATDAPDDGAAGANRSLGVDPDEPVVDDGAEPSDPLEAAGPGSPDPEDPAVVELLETASEQGTVRVVVTLRETRGMVGPLDSTQRRTAIAALQQDVLGRLPARADARGRSLPSAAASAARGVRTFTLSPGLALDVTPSELDVLLADPAVVSVTADRVVEPLLAASGQRIGMTRSGPNAGTFGGFSGRGYSIAILDTGVKSNHFALAGGPGVIHEACFSTNAVGNISLCGNGSSTQIGAGAAPDCSMSLVGCGHGTHVASTAAAMDHLDSSGRLTSVAKDAAIVAVQVFHEDTASGSVRGNASDIVAAMEHLHGVRDVLGRPLAAVNLSLGSNDLFPATCDTYVPAFTAAATALRDAGIAVVAASGNAGVANRMSWPACVSSVISVGSTVTSSDAISSFTNSVQGGTDLMAPGQPITAAYQSTGTTASIGALEGTSMAAPHVAGAFAVLKEAAPDRSVAQNLATLKQTGKTVSKGLWTGPRLDLAAAVASLAPNPPTRLSLTVRKGALRANWKAPAKGGTPAIGYTVEVDDGTGFRAIASCSLLAVKQRTCTVPASDLSLWGVEHQVRVRARSAGGTSAWVTSGSAVPFTVPTASAASLSTTTAPRAITTTWSDVVGVLAVEQGAAIRQVQVRATPVSGKARTCTAKSGRSGLPSSCTVTRLTAGVPHTVEVRMSNAAGWSGWVPVGSATPD